MLHLRCSRDPEWTSEGPIHLRGADGWIYESGAQGESELGMEIWGLSAYLCSLMPRGWMTSPGMLTAGCAGWAVECKSPAGWERSVEVEGGAGTAAMIGFPHYLKVEHSHKTLHKPKWCKVKKW